MKLADCRNCHRRVSDAEKSAWSYSMTEDSPRGRCNPPSLSQIEQLVAFMEVRPELAKGSARTANARDRNRKAWKEIGEALNNGGDGCIKTWGEWSKYWKDKKGAVKRKAGLIAAAHRAGLGEDAPELSGAELRIVALLEADSGEQGDVCVEVDPFQILEAAEDIDSSQSALESESDSVSPTSPSSGDPLAESPPQGSTVQGPRVVVPSTETRTQPDETDGHMISLYVPKGGPPNIRCENSTGTLGAANLPIRAARRRPVPQPRSRGSGAPPRGAPGPLRRPRYSHLAGLTEKLVAIEERRTEAELTTARTQEAIARGQEAISRGQEVICRGQEKLLEAVRTLTDALVQFTKK